MANVLLEEGNQYKEQGKFAEAIQAYQKALSLQPDQPAWVYINLGDAFNQERQFEQAISAYQKSIQLKPNNGSIYAKLATSLKNQGNYPAAIEAYQKAITLNEQQPPWVYIALIDTFNQENQPEAAISISQKAIRFYPKKPGIYRALAVAYSKTGNVNLAIANYQRAIEFDSNQPVWVYDQLANLQVAQQQYQPAVLNYIKCLHLNPNQFSRYSELDEALCQLYGNSKSSLQQGISKLLQNFDQPSQEVSDLLQDYIQFGFLGKQGEVSNPLGYYFISEQLKIVYCSIPKNACTLFKNMIVEHSDYKKNYDPTKQNIHQFIGSQDKNIRHLLSCLKSDQYFKFVVLRNPLERIVSAYLDKIAKHPLPEEFAQDVIREIQIHLNVEIDIQKSITFQQFVEYLCRKQDRDINDHWRPQHTFVGQVPFDYMGQFEKLDQTINILEEQFKIHLKRKVSTHVTQYKEFNMDLKFHEMYPPELRTLEGGLPKAHQLYTTELEAMIRKRYAKDIEVYESVFGVVV